MPADGPREICFFAVTAAMKAVTQDLDQLGRIHFGNAK
jgi:hypothetical protein